MKMKLMWLFKTLAVVYWMTSHNVPEDLDNHFLFTS